MGAFSAQSIHRVDLNTLRITLNLCLILGVQKLVQELKVLDYLVNQVLIDQVRLLQEPVVVLNRLQSGSESFHHRQTF